MKPTTQAGGRKKVQELIKDIRITMMTTIDAGGSPRSRPMHTQEAEFDGSAWFMTSADSTKAGEIARNPRVNLGYSSPSSESYLSATGKAKVLNDRKRIKDMWNPLLNAWFDGPDDPVIRLIKVDIEQVEYWNTPGGKIASVISLIKAAITGTPDDSNENVTLDLKSGKRPLVTAAPAKPASGRKAAAKPKASSPPKGASSSARNAKPRTRY